MERKIVENIIGQLKDVQNGDTWYDDNIENKINQLSEEEAFVRPIPELHSVAELISHMMAWRIDTVRRLTGLESKLTMESPENWRNNEELRGKGWDQLKVEFRKSQEDLVNALDKMDDDKLFNTPFKEYKLIYLVQGILHHDLYHLGQIGITVKFLKNRG